MNAEKLKKLQAEVRIGGKGTQRRKKKFVHSTQVFDDKKFQQTLKKLSLNIIPGIEEVNIIKTDGTVLHFKNPKTQAAISINTFAITGHPVTKNITEMMPYILPQLGPKELGDLKKTSENYKRKIEIENGDVKTCSTSTKCSDGNDGQDDVDEIPQLVDDFEAIALSDDNIVKENKEEN